MSDCIFCKIAEKAVPADIVYEDDGVIAFRDLDPKAPSHVLVIPKKHIASLIELSGEDAALLGHIMCEVIPSVARREGFAEKGFRVVTNIGEDGGQTVGHLHIHLLGGRAMKWPPG